MNKITMPGKKGKGQAAESEGFEEEESIASPGSCASSCSILNAETLQAILASNQAALLEGQRQLEKERAEIQCRVEQERAANQEKVELARITTQKQMERENQNAMRALIDALPSALPTVPRKSKVDVPKWNESESPSEYLQKYELAQVHNGVDKVEWGLLLQIYLTGSAQAAYNLLDPMLFRDYDALKMQLLVDLRDTPEQADRRWWSMSKGKESFNAFLVRMRTTANRRFEGCLSKEDMLEKILLSRFLYSLTAEQYESVSIREPKTASQAAAYLDDLVARTEFARVNLKGQERPPYVRKYHSQFRPSGQVVDAKPQEAAGGKPVPSVPQQSSNPPSGSNQVNGRQGSKPRQIICYSCKEPGHIKPNCPHRVRMVSPESFDGDSSESEDEVVPKVVKPFIVDGCVDGHVVEGMRYDTGCDCTVVAKHCVSPLAYIGKKIVLKGWRGAEKSVHELAKVSISVGSVVHVHKIVAVAEDFGYPALLGMDLSQEMHVEIMSMLKCWDTPGEAFKAQDEVDSDENRVRVTRAQEKKRLEAEQADDLATAESESTPVDLSAISELEDEIVVDDVVATPLAECADVLVEAVPMVSCGDRGALQKEQKADLTLTDLHELAKDRERGYRYDVGILVQDIDNEVGDVSTRIVVPLGRRDALLKLAHSGVASGHCGVKRTYARLASHFTWPRMYVQTKELVRICPGCQKAAKNRFARAPLQPLPCIGEPFRVVAMDLVGPLPRTASGHKYLLTLMDLHSKFPEAIPLKRVTNEVVLEAFMEIVSRHGIPETILTDQGSVFMSRLTKSLCELLGVERIRTSPYHPQSDGALERWHGCLKSMLKKEGGDVKNWDNTLKYLLFAYRDTPHTVTGFTPFELLYGRDVKGPLSLVHASWLAEESEGVEAHEWLVSLKEQLRLTSAVVVEKEKKAKAKMKLAYDKHAREKVFEVGEEVLVRRPGLKSKLGDSWDGPYKIKEKISSLSYKLEIPGRKSKVLHVNMMKKWCVESARVHGVAVVIEEEGECESPPGLSLSVEKGLVPTKGEQELLDKTLSSFPTVLCDVPGKTEAATMSIRTGDALPISSHPYRIPPKWREDVRAQIDNLLALGIIEPSESPWSSAVVTVKKKEGGCRICIDYRALNSVTTPDPYMMPFIEDILDTLATAKFMSKLDLHKGFHQIPVNDDDKAKTAFCTPWGKFQFSRMPFGLRNGPAVFQRMMDKILHEELEHCRVYIDDIVIFSQSWEQHCQHITCVMERLKTAGLTANVKKCQWAKQRFEFLGHTVGVGLVSPSVCKTQALREFQRPSTKRGVRQFLGLAGYYRRFIDHYAAHSVELTDATRKSAPDVVVWSSVMLEEFVYLKNVLCDVPSLTLPTIADEYILQTDASGRGVGAVLSVVRDGEEFPVAYYSRKLKPRETRYSATELEGLAVVNAVQHFYVYLVAQKNFTIVTDHRALVFLNTARHANGRLARWALALQPYSFTVVYRPGKMNSNADALSRCYGDSVALCEDDCQTPLEEGGGVMPRANTGQSQGGSRKEAEPEVALRQSH